MPNATLDKLRRFAGLFRLPLSPTPPLDPRVMVAHHGKAPYQPVPDTALTGIATLLRCAASDVADGMVIDADGGQLHYDCDHLVTQTLANGDLLVLTATLHKAHEAPGT